MNASISHVALLGSPRKAPRPRTRSRLALLAASASFAALASSAYAQCVEGPPSTFTCSGQTDAPQIIAADDATVITNPGFAVDTTNNGNGLALQVTGAGLISFDGSPDLTGGGVRFSTTGSSGLSAGEILVFSNGDIFATATTPCVSTTPAGATPAPSGSDRSRTSEAAACSREASLGRATSA
jgi:hypothetical protein